MDNAVMILAADYFDVTLGKFYSLSTKIIGVMFGISTLAAAGLGNIVSDVGGIGLGGIIETQVGKLGLPVANLTQVRFWRIPHVMFRVKDA